MNELGSSHECEFLQEEPDVERSLYLQGYLAGCGITYTWEGEAVGPLKRRILSVNQVCLALEHVYTLYVDHDNTRCIERAERHLVRYSKMNGAS